MEIHLDDIIGVLKSCLPELQPGLSSPVDLLLCDPVCEQTKGVS